jgi:hypothetical protein
MPVRSVRFASARLSVHQLMQGTGYFSFYRLLKIRPALISSGATQEMARSAPGVSMVHMRLNPAAYMW